MAHSVTVIGAGLAGSEATWQLAEAGVEVELVEMKTLRRTPAQVSDAPAELVCSNSFRSRQLQNAVGLLKDEMRRLSSLIIAQAYTTAVPAGDALAVDRSRFGEAIDDALSNHPRIHRSARIVEEVPRDTPAIVATGPLTDAALASDLVELTGRDRLFFYDSIAPIVDGESIDRRVVFEQSRYDKGDSADYLNCPMTEPEYDRFYSALRDAECIAPHAFEEPRYFQGCLPIEIVAASGRQSLLFGAMKPVGLTDPRTGKRPFAAVQLRKEDIHGQSYNMVGFQTKMKYGEQKRVLRLIPGLEDAEFLRLGAMHRNTYINSPKLLDTRFRLRRHSSVRFAGQITGVEGYVESAAHGLMVGRLLASELGETRFELPPATTALGALCGHVLGRDRIDGAAYEPQNINWGMVPRVDGITRREQKAARVQRALEALEEWAQRLTIELAPRAMESCA